MWNQKDNITKETMEEREESIKRKGKASWGDLERGGGSEGEGEIEEKQ